MDDFDKLDGQNGRRKGWTLHSGRQQPRRAFCRISAGTVFAVFPGPAGEPRPQFVRKRWSARLTLGHAVRSVMAVRARKQYHRLTPALASFPRREGFFRRRTTDLKNLVEETLVEDDRRRTPLRYRRQGDRVSGFRTGKVVRNHPEGQRPAASDPGGLGIPVSIDGPLGDSPRSSPTWLAVSTPDAAMPSSRRWAKRPGSAASGGPRRRWLGRLLTGGAWSWAMHRAEAAPAAVAELTDGSGEPSATSGRKGYGPSAAANSATLVPPAAPAAPTPGTLPPGYRHRADPAPGGLHRTSQAMTRGFEAACSIADLRIYRYVSAQSRGLSLPPPWRGPRNERCGRRVSAMTET